MNALVALSLSNVAVAPLLQILPVSSRDLWRGLRLAAGRDNILLVIVLFVVVALLSIRLVPSEWVRIRRSLGLFCVSLVLIFVEGFLESIGLRAAALIHHWLAFGAAGIVVVYLTSITVFDVVLTRVHVHMPRIMRDLVAALGYFAVVLMALSGAGVHLSQIIATSAILTAIVALSFQDTLGNILAGLALQMEDSINVGDWVMIGQDWGCVKEINWRHISIETTNWDTIILPNSMMMKGQVIVMGRREGAPVQHRQRINFNVDFRVPPMQVIAVVNEALQSAPIEHVALAPPPHCLLEDFRESYFRYVARYWLIDMEHDVSTDSVVRTRIYVALQRAGIRLSIPAQSVFVTEQTSERKVSKLERGLLHRAEALATVELFRTLTDEERHVLANRLSPAPFAKGETISRQGATALWLYILIKGTAEVQVTRDDGLHRVVEVLGAGDIFGEMELMTGDKRSETLIALEDIECYRLDKESFDDILHNRPEIADYISHVLARDTMALETAKEGLNAEAEQERMAQHQRAILERIRQFFGLHHVEPAH